MFINHAAGAFVVEGLVIADLRICADGAGIPQRNFAVRRIAYGYLCAVGRGAESKLTKGQSSQGKNTKGESAKADNAHGKSAESDQAKGEIGKGQQPKRDNADGEAAH